MNSKQKKLLEGPIVMSLWTLAFPIVLANILQAGYQLTDAFWVGRLGGSAVAAVSVSFPLIFLAIAVGTGFAIAGSTLISQYFGARNMKMVNHVASQTLLMIVMASLFLGIIGYLASPKILTLIGVAPDVYQNALGFMRVSFVGIVFSFSFFMFQSIMRGIGETKIPLYIVFGTVLLNFILDPLFIFGWGIVPAGGVMGAALATFGTQSLAAMLGLAVLLRGKYGIHLSLRDFKPDYVFMKRAFFLGLPASIEQSSRALGLTLLTFLIASFGTLTMAAFGAGSNVLQLVMIPALGLSMAISTLVGLNIGAGNIKRAEDIGRLGAWIGFWTLSGIGIVVFIFAPQLVAFFIPNDSAVVAAGTTFLRLTSLSWGFVGIQFSLAGVLRGSGNLMSTMVLAIVSQWVLQFPLAYILSRHTSLGVNGLWLAFSLTNILIALITMAWCAKGDWKKAKLTAEERLTEWVSEETLFEEGAH